MESKIELAYLYDFYGEDGVRHTVWTTSTSEVDKTIENEFKSLDALYIADGHHRCASAVKVGLKRREENKDFDGSEEFNFFLSVIFPANTLKILDYNRLVKDLNGYGVEDFLKILENKVGKVTPQGASCPYRPTKKHEVGVFVGGEWYSLEFYPELCSSKRAMMS